MQKKVEEIVLTNENDLQQHPQDETPIANEEVKAIEQHIAVANNQAVAQSEEPKQKKRVTVAANFSLEEYEYMRKALASRVENKDDKGNSLPLTKDTNHLIRQCVDFTLNSRKDAPKLVFALPDELPTLLFKNAFFKNNHNG